MFKGHARRATPLYLEGARLPIRRGAVLANRTFPSSYAQADLEHKKVPRTPLLVLPSLPLGRKQVRCSRIPSALRMSPRYRLILRCPPSVNPPDDPVWVIWRELPTSSPPLPLPRRPQSLTPPTVTHAQDCLSTCPRTLPLKIKDLEMDWEAALQMDEYAVLHCSLPHWQRTVPSKCSRSAPTAPIP